jgi:hypothetical protein
MASIPYPPVVHVHIQACIDHLQRGVLLLDTLRRREATPRDLGALHDALASACDALRRLQHSLGGVQ